MARPRSLQSHRRHHRRRSHPRRRRPSESLRPQLYRKPVHCPAQQQTAVHPRNPPSCCPQSDVHLLSLRLLARPPRSPPPIHQRASRRGRRALRRRGRPPPRRCQRRHCGRSPPRSSRQWKFGHHSPQLLLPTRPSLLPRAPRPLPRARGEGSPLRPAQGGLRVPQERCCAPSPLAPLLLGPLAYRPVLPSPDRRHRREGCRCHQLRGPSHLEHLPPPRRRCSPAKVPQRRAPATIPASPQKQGSLMLRQTPRSRHAHFRRPCHCAPPT